MTNFVYINGQFFPSEDAKISALDRGFFYGDGLFETLRIYKGRPFKLKEHLERLLTGCRKLKFKIIPLQKKLEKAVAQTIKKNSLNDGYLRITLSRGEVSQSAITAAAQPNLVIISNPVIPYKESLYKVGFKAKIVGIKIDPSGPLAGVKSLNYLPNILARQEALDSGKEEAILLDSEGSLAEGSRSNLFFISERKLYTPPLECGILDGITRRCVMEIGPELGFDIIEDRIQPSGIGSMEEAFLTSSLMEIMPLVEIDEKPVGKGIPGPKTIKIHIAYQTIVNLVKKTVDKLT